MKEALLDATTGRELQDDIQAKVNIFWCPRESDGPGATECFIGKAAKDGAGGLRRVSASPPMSAVAGANPKHMGEWRTNVFSMPEGTVLKVFAYIKPGWNTTIRNASQFIRMRNDAALVRIKIPLIGSNKSALATAEITGRFDILTAEEGLEAINFDIHPNYIRFFTPGRVKKTMNIITLEQEKSAVAVLKSREFTDEDTGEKRVIYTRKRTRNLDL